MRLIVWGSALLLWALMLALDGGLLLVELSLLGPLLEGLSWVF